MIKTRSLGAVGAEVLELDLARADEDTSARLYQLLLDQELLVFRNQKLTDDAMVAFAGRLGILEGGRFQRQRDSSRSEVVVLSNAVEEGKPVGLMEVGQYWHSDGTFLPAPDMFTMLYGVKIPRDAGGNPLGDTLFVSATRAYEALPADLKRRVEDLQGVSSYDFRYQMRLAKNPALKSARAQVEAQEPRHPVVRPHPLTGRKALFVNEGYTTRIEGMPETESQALLDALYQHLYHRQPQYRHRWQEGDVLLWDNNATQHCAVADYSLPQVRLMKRVSVKTAAAVPAIAA